MEFEYSEGEGVAEPVSPTGTYFTSSVLSVSNLCILEFEVPIDKMVPEGVTLVKNVFLSVNPRFSSIMVEKNGKKHWKRVQVQIEDHVHIPTFPPNQSPESYDKYFHDYMSNLAVKRFSQDKPLWEIHGFTYPTSSAAGTIIFLLHHALGDGFSLMGALLSCLQRASNPSIPLTFPSRQRSQTRSQSFMSKLWSSVSSTVYDLLHPCLDEDDLTPIRSGNGVEFQPMTISTVTFCLDQIKLIKNRLGVGVTVNDVLTGMIFLGTRLYMQAMNKSSSKARGSAVVCLSTRMNVDYSSVPEMIKPSSNSSAWGNRFTLLNLPIPELTDDFSDALAFVWKAHKLISMKRNSLGIYLTAFFLEMINKFRGPEAVARYIHSTLKNSSMMISNLIGPLEQMALANHPVKGLYFFALGLPQGLDAMIVSYMGKVRIAFKMEKDFMDPQKLNSSMETAYEMILKASAKHPMRR